MSQVRSPLVPIFNVGCLSPCHWGGIVLYRQWISWHILADILQACLTCGQGELHVGPKANVKWLKTLCYLLVLLLRLCQENCIHYGPGWIPLWCVVRSGHWHRTRYVLILWHFIKKYINIVTMFQPLQAGRLSLRQRMGKLWGPVQSEHGVSLLEICEDHRLEVLEYHSCEHENLQLTQQQPQGPRGQAGIEGHEICSGKFIIYVHKH